jgi:DNA-binding NarL/FixJ family response regulator
MTGMNFGADRPLGIDLIEELKVHLPATRCIVLTADTSFDLMYCAYSVGAIGYVSKSSTAQDITRAIELVHQSKLCFPEDFEALRERYKKVPTKV